MNNTVKKLDLVELLEHSLSLSIKEKIGVIDMLPELDEERLDALMQVFKDEKHKFEDIKASEKGIVEKMKQNAAKEWKIICEQYETLNQA